MYQWIRFYQQDPPPRELGHAQQPAPPPIETFGPDHPDRATANAWLRANLRDDLGEFRLAGPAVRVRVAIVIDGLDDDGAAPTPAPVEQPATEKRRGRPPKGTAGVDLGETMRGVETVARPVATNAGPYACLGCGVMVGAEHKIECSTRQPSLPVPVEAEASADDSPAPTLAETTAAAMAEVARLDALDPPPLAPQADEVAAAILGDVAPSGPCVELNGLVVEVYDGNEWFWQRYQTTRTAEGTARKAQEAIDAGSEIGLRGVVVMLRKGRVPAEV